MAFNGSGVFVRLYNWVNDAAANIKIRADRMDAEFDGIATGLTNCITKDGQTTITANLPMGGYKHTNVANASSNNEYAAFGQIATAISAITLDSLSDVVLTSTAAGDHIYYNGTNWVNVAKTAVPIDGIQTTGTSGVILKNSAGTTVLTAGASAGTLVTCAGALTATGALTASSTLSVTGVSTLTGRVDTSASTTSSAGIRIPHGTAPTTPTNGDLWTTSSGAFVQINGATARIDNQKSGGVSLYQTTGTVLTTTTWVTLLFDTEIYDDFGWHSTSVDTGRITVDFTGRIHIIGTVDFNALGSAIYSVRLLRNGSVIKRFETTPTGGGTTSIVYQVSDDTECTSGDYFELQAQTNNGSPTSGTGIAGTSLKAHIIKS